MKKSILMTIILMVFIFFVSPTYAAITIGNLPAVDTADCDHGTKGWTKTMPLVWHSAQDLFDDNAAAEFDSIVNYQNPAFPGTWDFQISFAAAGEANVDIYEPRDGTKECEHGAEIKISLSNLILPDGQELQWINLYGFEVTENSVPEGDPTSGYNVVDPPIGYEVPPETDPCTPGIIADPRPFYYNIDGLGSGTAPMPDDGYFYDKPATYPLDAAVPHSGWWAFSALITSWNGTYSATSDNVVNVYGMVDWGYYYECVPEPGTVLMLGLGGLILRRRK